MPLKDGKFPEFHFDGDAIHFTMEDGDEIVMCSVDPEYLITRSELDGFSDQPLRALFILYRGEIEQIASDKYDLGEVRPHVSQDDVTLKPLI
jgi:uncharacterized protein DUF1488